MNPDIQFCFDLDETLVLSCRLSIRRGMSDIHGVRLFDHGGDAWGSAVRPGALPRDCPTMLRALTVSDDGPVMETSHGARVPLADAKRTYRFAMHARAKGWHKNGETHAIGNYQLDSVNEQGVIAGCHRVTWSEIETFAKAQGWSA